MFCGQFFILVCFILQLMQEIQRKERAFAKGQFTVLEIYGMFQKGCGPQYILKAIFTQGLILAPCQTVSIWHPELLVFARIIALWVLSSLFFKFMSNWKEYLLSLFVCLPLSTHIITMWLFQWNGSRINFSRCLFGPFLCALKHAVTSIFIYKAL